MQRLIESINRRDLIIITSISDNDISKLTPQIYTLEELEDNEKTLKKILEEKGTTKTSDEETIILSALTIRDSLNCVGCEQTDSNVIALLDKCEKIIRTLVRSV